jgi:large conductance mechanosensitive channel
MKLSKEKEMLEELKKIRELLTSSPAPEPPKGFWNEFTTFLSKYKVMGAAIAFIIGIYVGQLVQALVDDLIMPIISIVTPGVEWENILVGPFRVGHFIGTLITFLIVILVVFMLVKFTKKTGLE